MNADDSSKVSGHAFISYVREDSERVDRLQGILETAGIRIWRDVDNLWPGQDWKIQISQAITTRSLAFIACFSENSERRAKTYQNEELILAAEQMRLRRPGVTWLIPVRFASCDVPAYDLGAARTLNSLQRVDLFGNSWERGAARLVATVLRILGTPLMSSHLDLSVQQDMEIGNPTAVGEGQRLVTALGYERGGGQALSALEDGSLAPP